MGNFFPASVLSLEIQTGSFIYFAVKTTRFVLLACGVVLLSSCATSEDFNATQTANALEPVPGEVNSNGPDASQQGTNKPGFNF